MFKAVNISANVIKFVVAIVGCALAILAAKGWDQEAENVSEITPYVSGAVQICMIIIVAAAAIAVAFGLYHFILNIGKRVPQLVGVLAFVAILCVAWFGMTTWGLDEYLSYRGGKFVDPEVDTGLTQGLITLSDGGVWSLFILVPLAVVLAVGAEIWNFIKLRF